MTRVPHPRLGDERLSEEGKADGAGHSRKPVSKKRDSSKGAPRKGGARASDLGRALRSAYDDTVREPIPGDFLDLLGKLN